MTYTTEEMIALVKTLDRPCWSCTDVSKPQLSDPEGRCTICSGSGYTLTEAGVALLEFIRRHEGEER